MKNGDMPAIPISVNYLDSLGEAHEFDKHLGLTKREYYAVKMMAVASRETEDWSICYAKKHLGMDDKYEWTSSDGDRLVARRAIEFADALLTELEK